MRVITLDINNTIVGVKDVGNSYTLQSNEVESHIGELGQIMKQDGSFVNPSIAPTTPEPTLEDKINYIYYKQMGVI